MSEIEVQFVNVLAYLLASTAGLFSVGVAVGVLVLAFFGRVRK